MVFIVVKQGLPNKQRLAHERIVTPLKDKLERINKNELDSELIKGPVSLEFNLFMNMQRYVRQGNDNEYIGDLDNLLSGIMDELKNMIIKDDDQIMKINAKKNIIKDEELSYYTIKIEQIID
jgi:Holliday junction resolvase RusA-like endonuclease